MSNIFTSNLEIIRSNLWKYYISNKLDILETSINDRINIAYNGFEKLGYIYINYLISIKLIKNFV